MIELAQDNDTMTDSQDVAPEITLHKPNVPITKAKLDALYTAGMHLAHTMRRVGEAECANDVEVWILGMKHELEAFLEEEHDPNCPAVDGFGCRCKD